MVSRFMCNSEHTSFTTDNPSLSLKSILSTAFTGPLLKRKKEKLDYILYNLILYFRQFDGKTILHEKSHKGRA